MKRWWLPLLLVAGCGADSPADADTPRAFVEQVLVDVYAIVAANPSTQEMLGGDQPLGMDWFREQPVFRELRDYYAPLVHPDTPVEWEADEVVVQVFSDGTNPSLCHHASEPWPLTMLADGATAGPDGVHRVRFQSAPPDLEPIEYVALVVETPDGWRFRGFPFRWAGDLEPAPAGD